MSVASNPLQIHARFFPSPGCAPGAGFQPGAEPHAAAREGVGRGFPRAEGGARAGTSPGLSCAAGAEGGRGVAGGRREAGRWARAPPPTLGGPLGRGAFCGMASAGWALLGGGGLLGRASGGDREHVCVRVFIWGPRGRVACASSWLTRLGPRLPDAWSGIGLLSSPPRAPPERDLAWFPQKGRLRP